MVISGVRSVLYWGVDCSPLNGRCQYSVKHGHGVILQSDEDAKKRCITIGGEKLQGNNRWTYLWPRVEVPDTFILPMVGLPL